MSTSPGWEESLDEEIDGVAVVAEYAHLKEAIERDNLHTLHEGHVSIVRDALLVPEGGSVVDKIRGGRLDWEDVGYNQSLTHVDHDPTTFDRISLERIVNVDGAPKGSSSIIFSETTEVLPDGTQRLVVEKSERYTVPAQGGDIVGERYAKVHSPSGVIIEKRHVRQRTPTPPH